MARRPQPRHRSGPLKGKFKKRGSGSPKRRRRNPHTPAKRSAAPRRKAAAAYRSYSPKPRRRNKPRRLTMKNIVREITTGTMDAGLVLVGKAGARTIPTLLPQLPQEGPLGLTTQALTGVLLSVIARWVLKADQAHMILVGALTGPLETLVVAQNVPFLAEALNPAASADELSAYYGMGAYVQPALPPPSVEDNAGSPGLGAYVPAYDSMSGWQ